MNLLTEWDRIKEVLGANEEKGNGDLVIENGEILLRIGRSAAAQNRLSMRSRDKDGAIVFAPFFDAGTVSLVEFPTPGTVRLYLGPENSPNKIVDISRDGHYEEIKAELAQVQ